MSKLEIAGAEHQRSSEIERTKLLDEIEIKQRTHEGELERLMVEISALHDEKNNL